MKAKFFNYHTFHASLKKYHSLSQSQQVASFDQNKGKGIMVEQWVDSEKVDINLRIQWMFGLVATDLVENIRLVESYGLHFYI